MILLSFDISYITLGGEYLYVYEFIFLDMTM